MSWPRDGGSYPGLPILSHVINPASAGPDRVVFGHLLPDRCTFLIFFQHLVIRLSITWTDFVWSHIQTVIRMFFTPSCHYRRVTPPPSSPPPHKEKIQKKKKTLWVLQKKPFTFADSRMGESVAGSTLHQTAKSTSRRLARELLSSCNVNRAGTRIRAPYW